MKIKYEEIKWWKVADIIHAAADKYKIPESTVKEKKDAYRRQIIRELSKRPDKENSYWKKYEKIEKKPNPRVDESPIIKKHFIPKDVAQYIYQDVMNDYFRKDSSDEVIRNKKSQKELSKMEQEYRDELLESLENLRKFENREEISVGDEQRVENVYLKTMIEAIFKKFYNEFDMKKLTEDDAIVELGEMNFDFDEQFFESLERITNPHKYYYTEKKLDDMVDRLADKVAERIIEKMKLNK